MNKFTAIVLAAGSGKRMEQDIPYNPSECIFTRKDPSYFTDHIGVPDTIRTHGT